MTSPVFMAMVEAPPSSNNMYVNTPTGRVLTADARSWKTATGLRLTAAARDVVCIRHCKVTATFNIDHRSDISNRVKGLHDALRDAGVIEDDRYVEMSIEARSDRCVVTRSPIDPGHVAVIVETWKGGDG